MTAATTPVVAEPRTGRAARAAFRGDIQGLRAVAVVLVLLYHAGVPWTPGGYVGVDVFFVISGFLITGLIVRELEQTGRLSLAGFYARRVRRLLPATAVTFVGVALLTITVLPVTRWATVAGDMVASTLYVVNWRLADRSVDYLAQGAAESPLQHFWSLAVEEQFYVVWPLLIVALVWWARRGRRRDSEVVSRSRLGWGLVAISLPSLAWSVHLTGADPGPAYFVTTTRLWELAVGALLAVGAQRAGHVPAVVRTAVGWLGIAAVLVAAVTYTSATAFPGAAALLPTLGAAAVLWAGTGDDAARLRFLEWQPMQAVGAWSYSLYLWHWPLLVAAAAVWAGPDGALALPTAVLVAGLSVVPAWLTYRLVELPLHRSPSLARPARAAVLGLLCVAVGLGSALAIHRATPRAEPVSTATAEQVGAAALGAEPSEAPAGEVLAEVESITPAPVAAADDNPDVYDDECHQRQDDATVLECTYGAADAPVEVALVGDSHAAQWQPALREVAEARQWRLTTHTKSACPLADTLVWLANEDRPYTDCLEWGRRLVDQLRQDAPDVVVVSSGGSYSAVAQDEQLDQEASDAALVAGMADSWRALLDHGSEVLVVLDTPWMGIDLPECVAENRDDLSACAVDRRAAVAESGAGVHLEAAQRLPEVGVVDLTSFVCPRERCAPVIGGVLVYRDEGHLTATYARSMAAPLEKAVADALGD